MYILKNVFIIFSVTLILLYQQVVTVVRYMLFKKNPYHIICYGALAWMIG